MPAISGVLNTEVVTPPSTCISSYSRLPSRTRISTGGNTPGTLAEATSTSRNSVRAASPLCCAISPRFHSTVSCLSRSVVATTNRRPLSASRATASIISAVTKWSTSSNSGS
jgi:hypothetical protein